MGKGFYNLKNIKTGDFESDYNNFYLSNDPTMDVMASEILINGMENELSPDTQKLIWEFHSGPEDGRLMYKREEVMEMFNSLSPEEKQAFFQTHKKLIARLYQEDINKENNPNPYKDITIKKI